MRKGVEEEDGPEKESEKESEKEGGGTEPGPLDDMVAMVTGANSGIGKATTAGLARRGATVVMMCRNAEKAKRAREDIVESTGNDDLDILLADLSSFGQVRDMALEFRDRYDRLDILVNNAGGLFDRRMMTEDGWEYTFQVNHLSHFLLTHLLLDMLKEDGTSRIVNVSSGAHAFGTIHFDDIDLQKGYGSWRAYGQAKLANVLFTYELDRRLDEEDRIMVNAMHPGVVKTDFHNKAPITGRIIYALGGPFLRSPAEGADTVVYLAASPEVEGVSGRYFKDREPKRSSRESRDREVARRLWELSEEATERYMDIDIG